MNNLTRAVGSLLAGVVVFALVAVGVTEALASRIWLSVMVGLPVGIVAGLTAVALTYLGVTYRAERASTGKASARTVAHLWATVAALLAFFVVGGGTTWSLSLQAMGLMGAMMFVGAPLGVLAATLAAYLVSQRVQRRQPPRPAAVG